MSQTHLAGQEGARKVFAVGVGHGQVACKIRDDPRVITWKKRTPAIFPGPKSRNRSVIVGDNSVSEVEPSEPDCPIYLTLDGRNPVLLEFGSTFVIRRAEKTLPLAVLPEFSFFSVVRQKLKWSGSTI